jgi:hypothetical protein
MHEWFPPYTQVKDESGNGPVTASQPAGEPGVLWSVMKYFRRKQASRNGGSSHRRHLRGEPPLYAASLGSPIFVESWNGGSPLNWVEFMGNWESTRVDRKTRNRED